MGITLSVNDSISMFSEQQSLFYTARFSFCCPYACERYGLYFIWQLCFAASCRIVYCVTIVHSTDCPLTRRIAVGSDKPYLSNKIRTIYVKNECNAIISARISLNKIWFLCPVLVYYELASVPKKVSSILQSFPNACSQHRLILSAKKSLVHAGQGNVMIQFILTHWGRMTQICVFNTRLFSLHNTLNYAIHRACLRMVLLTDVYRNLTSLWNNL